jgi:hypothetical protein
MPYQRLPDHPKRTPDGAEATFESDRFAAPKELTFIYDNGLWNPCLLALSEHGMGSGR